MAIKYHCVNGELRKCVAEIRECNYGPHFDSIEKGQLYADDENRGVADYQILKDLPDEEILSFLKIKEKSKIKELDVLLEHINKNALYGAENPKVYLKGIVDSEEKQKEINEALEISMPNHSKKAVHLVAEDSYNYYIWTNSSDQRDVIVYDKFANRFPITEIDKKQRYVTRIEVKDLTKGAQLHQTIGEKNENTIGYSIDSTDKINEQLKQWDPRKNAYENMKVKLTQDESYDYLLNDYYNTGASELSLYSDKQKKIISIPITEKDKKDNFETAKSLLKSNNIEVEVKVRANSNALDKKVSQKDIERFKKDYGCMFKDEIAKEEFTIEDLNYGDWDLNGTPNRAFVRTRKKIEATYSQPASKRDRTFVRMGEFYFETKEDFLDKKVKMKLSDFRMYKPCVTGVIKEK